MVHHLACVLILNPHKPVSHSSLDLRQTLRLLVWNMCPESRGLVKIVLVGSLPASVTLLAACPASTHIEAWSEAPSRWFTFLEPHIHLGSITDQETHVRLFP